MFTQAGFNRRGRAVCRAQVSRIEGGTRQTEFAYLWHFACGDYAYASRTQLCWPHLVRIHSLFEIDYERLEQWRFSGSRLP